MHKQNLIKVKNLECSINYDARGFGSKLLAGAREECH